MRILIFVTRLTGGGAERVASLWANGFVQRGHEVGLVVKWRDLSHTYPLSDQIQVFNIWNYGGYLLQKYFRYKQAPIKSIRRVIHQFQPDVAICVLQPWGEWVLKASKDIHLPIVNTEHSTWEKPDNAVYGRITKKRHYWRYVLNQQFDCVTVLTEADKICAKDYLNNVVVMPNPLAFSPAVSVPPKEKTILAVGRLDIWQCKGFDILIKAWSRIAQDRPEWKLVMCGQNLDGAREFLQTMAREQHVDQQVEVLAFQDDILTMYQKASIFVLSSRYEGFGMVLIEAMSQGCAPVVCDYKGRQREIITNEQEGIICPTEDPVALSKALARMIDDEPYRNMVQMHAIARSKHYDLDRIMDIWETILKERIAV